MTADEIDFSKYTGKIDVQQEMECAECAEEIPWGDFNSGNFKMHGFTDKQNEYQIFLFCSEECMDKQVAYFREN